MLKTKRFTVDGHEYEVRQLGALEGRRLWLDVLKMLTGPLKAIGAAADLDEKAILGALAAAVDGLEEKTAEKLYDAFGKSCTFRDGSDEKWPDLTATTFDLHFAGRYLAMSKWLAECILFNFADFLGDISLGKVIATVRAAASKRGSPTDSTGSSGES